MFFLLSLECQSKCDPHIINSTSKASTFTFYHKHLFTFQICFVCMFVFVLFFILTYCGFISHCFLLIIHWLLMSRCRFFVLFCFQCETIVFCLLQWIFFRAQLFCSVFSITFLYLYRFSIFFSYTPVLILSSVSVENHEFVPQILQALIVRQALFWKLKIQQRTKHTKTLSAQS